MNQPDSIKFTIKAKIGQKLLSLEANKTHLNINLKQQKKTCFQLECKNLDYFLCIDFMVEADLVNNAPTFAIWSTKSIREVATIKKPHTIRFLCFNKQN